MSTTTKRFAAALCLALTLCTPALARMYEEPRSSSLDDRSVDRIDRRTLQRIDRQQLLADDVKLGRTPARPGPVRFAVTEDTDLSTENSGTWVDLQDGRLWRLVIKSPEAVSQNIGFTRFELPAGAKLWVYDSARKRIEGPYTNKHRSRHGRLWTPILESDEMVVELFVPRGAGRPDLVIGKVNKGYRTIGKGGLDKSHGACNNDVICPEGDPWRDQIRSVARYSINGTGLCSGQLVNNTALDFTPYFLSANHCGVTAANDDTLVFYWNFESPVCGNQGGGSLADNQTGSIFRATNAASDFLLVELAADPDPAFNVFFSGWDATGAAPASTVGIHHPSGDVKSISFNTNAVTSTAYGSNTVSAGANHWRVDDWEDGTTEGGSSGSCLWDAATGRCIGQLHGGNALCSAPNESDWYGKLSVSWTGGGTAATRLSDWLDPLNTGSLTLDGDPHIQTLDGTRYDFQGAGEFVALRDPRGTEIQVRQAPIGTTWVPGPDSHHGLSTCVSLNTAVAARVGTHRVTYQPNLSGAPDPSGLQLRINGNLTTLDAAGIDLAGGGRIARTSAQGGIEIAFPDQYTLYVTPGWWTSQSKWYLNVGVVRTATGQSAAGAAPGSGGGIGGLGGPIRSGSWLPVLPDGSSMGPMPGALHDRYVALYQKFGAAWRVTNANTLFDYAPGTSTASFTVASWPPESLPCDVPQQRPVRRLPRAQAEEACAALRDKGARHNCAFDVEATGERGFARTYLASERVRAGATRLGLRSERRPDAATALFIATVVRVSDQRGVARGAVQFFVDGERKGKPLPVDGKGRAIWKARDISAAKHRVSALFMPEPRSGLLSSSATYEYVAPRQR